LSIRKYATTTTTVYYYKALLTYVSELNLSSCCHTA